MNTKLLFSSLILCGLLTAGGCKKEDKGPGPDQEALSHTSKHSAEVATAWYHLLAEITRTKPYVPPQTTRIFAYTGMALYESVVPGMPSYQSMYTYLTGNTLTYDKRKDYYWPAVANAALARIASKMLSVYPAPDLTPIQQLETTFSNRFASEINAAQMQLSVEFGQYVADNIYQWSTTDGTLTAAGTLAPCPPYTPVGGPGNWVPTPPSNFPAAGACQGSLRTFIPGIVTATRPAPPPVYSTAPASPFYEMAEEVYQLATNASAEDNVISQAWRDLVGTNYNTPAHMLKLTAQIADKKGLNLEEAAVLFAREGIAMFDAIAASFDAKFHYALMRPITYIQNALGKTNFNTLYPTPQHPSYPAVAPAAAGAAVVILEDAWGANYAFTDSTQKSLYGNWTYTSFDGLLQDVERSRSHSGLNFLPAVAAGSQQGRQVGQRVLALPFKKP